MTTFPLTTLGPTITPAGITIPSFTDIYASLQASFKAIYGQDAYIEPDSQDGQWLGVLAQGYSDTNNGCVTVYNAYSPATSQGTALSSVVKINGLEREVPSNSQSNLTIIGVAGTNINNGVVQDVNGNQWALPPNVLVPNSGVVVATATCTVQGDIAAAPNTINQILTPTRGWQTVTNSAAAIPGAPVEQDPALRGRQANSTMLPAQTISEALEGDLGNLPGVQQVVIFDNDKGQYNGYGIPLHDIAVVVQGGDAGTIAQAIATQKTPGTGTYGSTSEIVIDNKGVPNTIKFSVPTQEQIVVAVYLTPLTGYSSATGAAIQTAISNYINSQGINANNGTLYRSPLIGVAYGAGPPGTYDITSIQISISPSLPAVQDLPISFDQIPVCAPGNVSVTVA